MKSNPESKDRTRNWIARALIAVVLTLNLQAALQYMIAPQAFSAGFELSGTPGATAVAGVGILYLMWQVPYVFALTNPISHKISLIEALLMQAIGLLGESWLLSTIDPNHAALRSSIVRYIIFDAGGLVLLACAYGAAHCRRLLFKKGETHV